MDDKTPKSATAIKQFRILSIEITDPPAHVAGGEWYSYSIGHESSPIQGLRSGSLKSVRKHLEEYVEKLNTRALYGYSAYAANKGKSGAK
jgi:hypothetical protein